MMNGRPQQIILHVIGCAVFLSLPVLFSPESLSLTNPPTQRDFIAYLLLLGVFYSNYYLLIPKLYFRRKYVPYTIINILYLILITILPHILNPYHGPPPPFFQQQHHPPPPIHFFINDHFFLFLVVLFLALLLKIRDRWIRAEDEKVHAELAYLKAQINPHFLFNTLNSIYAMALGRSEQTAGAIVKLSSMMRYVLVEAGKEKVAMEKEITYLTDYIQLQQTRFEGSLKLRLDVTGERKGKTIHPLLLIPFVENAFKYGVNPEQPSIIQIRIDIGESDVHLFVGNEKVAMTQPDDTPGGLGIQNTRRRLQLLYPGRHTLVIDDQPNEFTVSLTLKGI